MRTLRSFIARLFGRRHHGGLKIEPISGDRTVKIAAEAMQVLLDNGAGGFVYVADDGGKPPSDYAVMLHQGHPSGADMALQVLRAVRAQLEGNLPAPAVRAIFLVAADEPTTASPSPKEHE